MIDVDVGPFGRLPDGRVVERVDLVHGATSVGILSYGGILASIRVPDAAGRIDDVALGFASLDGWLHDPQYLGAIVGRFANRIAHGRFPLDGGTVEVTRNHGDHHLHGGIVGFDKVLWHLQPFEHEGLVGVELTHTSADGHEGYPGTLVATVTYTLDGSGALKIRYEAIADAPTVVNLSNHVYLNLDPGGTILDHRVRLHAATYLEIGEGTIPTGRILPVDGSPLDFRSARRIGDRIDEDDPQLRLANGYDHCFVVDGRPGRLRPCARVDAGGRTLTVTTTQPGVQFYTGNGLRRRTGRRGVTYGPHSGLCLETQHFPDSPNHPEFPSTRLDPGDRYDETTVLRFST